MNNTMKIEEIDQKLSSLLREVHKLKNKKRRLEKAPKCKFILKCSYEILLSEDEIWPDYDGPLKPTINDVKKVIREYGSDYTVIDEWGLVPGKKDKCKIDVLKLNK